MAFKKGDKVTWSSAANGSWKTKTGVITHVHKGSGGDADHYEVLVPAPEGSTARSKCYSPRTSALKLAK